ncbi:PP2C family protein-serine/threonine phosphatase [Solwaraspora sp. WMMD406]|uniref:PP2C family protein-serine/threonine phosphatase n=1 Tax=Solwaraspora sp. WMMD406 TaxID=3016095 RepID=UPI002417891A|nr:PP2C family protein-serine/threonine phosphatase [Solwaraspora sp. WMMD406]MDG4766305.1 PP2C family protein-serine/threonine phosphatase [Solwaraspora sp. WMMD406]
MSAADVTNCDSGDGSVRAPEPTASTASGAGLPAAGVRCAPADLLRQPAIVDQAVIDNFREGLVVCDGAGVVRHVDATARRLLPELASDQVVAASGIPGLAAAMAAEVTPAELSHRGHRLRLRRVTLGPDRIGWYVDDATDSTARSDALLAERARWMFLATASQQLGNPLHEDRAARAAVRLAVPTLGEVAILVLAPRRGRAQWWRARGGAAGTRPEVDGGMVPMAELPPAFTEALAGVEPTSVDWLAEQLVDVGWLTEAQAGEALPRITGLPGSARPTGVLVVVRSRPAEYDDADDHLLRGFAARAGSALDAAVLFRHQSEIAETLQASLLPTAPTPVAGLQWGTAYRPAQSSLRIGGDFYGAFDLSDGNTLFFLGDVSGKGVEAAVFTGQVRQGLQALRNVETDPRQLLRLLNESVLETTQAHGQGRFATMVLGVAEPGRDGGVTVTLAGGGHLPPLVLRADGTVEPVPLSGMLIGVVPDPRIGQVAVHLAAGETCLLYSDGVTEARGGRYGDEQYGLSRLVHALRGCHRMPAPALAERVEQLAGDWLAGREHDDIAVFAVRADRPSSRARGRHLHAVPDTITGTGPSQANPVGGSGPAKPEAGR